MTPNHCYSVRLDEAVGLAMSSFRAVRRKGTEIPYLTHLLQVMTWVGEHGGDEEQMIAAVLHDYLEDIPGASREELDRRFGVRVGRLVAELSDKPSAADTTSWSNRKVAYLARLPSKPTEVKLVSVADKLHNARCIHRDFRALGAQLWDRFNGGRDGTLWYYRGLVRALSTRWSHPLVDELAAEVAALHAAAGVVYVGEEDV